MPTEGNMRKTNVDKTEKEATLTMDYAVIYMGLKDYDKVLFFLEKALEEKGPSIIISRGPCALWNDRNKRRRGEKIQPYYVDQSMCRKCHTCMRDFYCPAITMESTITEFTDKKEKTWNGYSSYISPELCDGCGVCSIVCPYTNHETRSENDVIKPYQKPREVRHDL